MRDEGRRLATSTELRFHLRAIEDLHAMLVERGDWMPLGSDDEQKACERGAPSKPGLATSTTPSAAGTD